MQWELITSVSPARRTDGVLLLRSESAAPTRPYAVGLVESRRACPGSCRRTPRPAFTDLGACATPSASTTRGLALRAIDRLTRPSRTLGEL